MSETQFPENDLPKFLTDTNILTILQMSDSAFPTGGFTHSLGCEAALQCGYITNKDNFRVFVISCLENAGSFSLPFVREAHKLYLDYNALLKLDRLYNVYLVNHVARRASLQQGRSLLSTCCRTFLITHLDALQKYIDDGSVRGHQAVIFGAICGVLKIPVSEVLYMFMFGMLRTLVASMVRLGKIVGSLEGQRFQYELQRIIPDIVARNVDKSPEDACISFPMPDIIQNFHDKLFSRLFYS
ncbi:uncharacterized protein LOC143252311 [Tachypleus tridentatus]|uniref:uncharacterized protein LOC143252311 n=1 Tax=Tachypleus tridentatus TaxID=6853 RepID=UPI003FD2107B